MRAATSLALLIGLAACGNQAALRPPQGQSLPPNPATAAATPTPAELLTPSPEARPARETELLRRSRERAEDPFDLPPTP